MDPFKTVVVAMVAVLGMVGTASAEMIWYKPGHTQEFAADRAACEAAAGVPRFEYITPNWGDTLEGFSRALQGATHYATRPPGGTTCTMGPGLGYGPSINCR